MTVCRYLYGAPGTGKTRWVVNRFAEYAKQVGRDRAALITYTRSAAGEAAYRAGQALGLRDAKAGLPYVGTIHSLAYALLGRPPVVGNKEYGSFCLETGIEAPRSGRAEESALDLGDDDTTETEEGAVLRRVVAESRHRHIPVDVAAAGHRDYNPDRLSFLADRYKEWKRREGLFDFEDLLVQGMKKPLPVKVLMVDEAQDNSPLLWAVINRWGQNTDTLVCAGDPWQAIYVFAGADPRLFRSQPGAWRTLETSHRLTKATAGYAKAILRTGGWEDPLFDKWDGAGSEERESDGSTLYLARTHKLLGPVRERLIQDGEPFGEYTRKSLLQTVAAQSYIVFSRLLAGQIVGWGDFKAAATYARRYIPAGQKPRRAVPQRGPTNDIAQADAELWLGDVRNALDYLPNSDYFKKVEKNYGQRGLILRPKTMIGTIHSAKGREADHVKLVASWGWLPSRALREESGRKREALVAYVAATRHRLSFELLDARFGARYPWPEK